MRAGRVAALVSFAWIAACAATDSVSGTVMNAAHVRQGKVEVVVGLLGSDGLPMQSIGAAPKLDRLNPVVLTDGEGRFTVDIEPDDESNHFWMAHATYTIAVERPDGTLAALRKNGKVVSFVIEPPRDIELSDLVMDAK